MTRSRDILELVQLTVDVELEQLRSRLAESDLKAEYIYRLLLTYLPEGADPQAYIPILQDLSLRPTTDRHRSQAPYTPEGNDHGKVQRLQLLTLHPPLSSIDPTSDLLTLFLIHRAHRIDDITGSLDLIARLLAPFRTHSVALQDWIIGIFLPILRITYHNHYHSISIKTLVQAEAIDESSSIEALLPASGCLDVQKPELARNLRDLVGPRICGKHRRKTSIEETHSWDLVNGWLLQHAEESREAIVAAYIDWNGPADVNLGDWGETILPSEVSAELLAHYAQTGLAMLYKSANPNQVSQSISEQLIARVSVLANISAAQTLTESYISSIQRTDMAQDTLLSVQNTLTKVTSHSLLLAQLIIISRQRLLDLGHDKSPVDLLCLSLFASETSQRQELRSIINVLKKEKATDWSTVRLTLLWLRDWDIASNSYGTLGKIDRTHIESELLRLMLDSANYDLSARIYCDGGPLARDEVHDIITEAALLAYDTASNGNKKRGGVRKANELISFFHQFFTTSDKFQQIAALVNATHAMSFYSLTLQPGIPFLPINIRVHKDPMLLIEKILEQNDRSYTKLDDLVGIGQCLVSAGIVPIKQGIEQELSIARKRVIKMAIESALKNNDFETAYSYVMNRLPVKEIHDAKHPIDSSRQLDDISWRAAAMAGRQSTTHSQDSRPVEQRMELLSHAILLAPATAIPELLETWQLHEESYLEIKSQEALEEQLAEQRVKNALPGDFETKSDVNARKRDFGRIGLQEDAPMGLFDVARGAAEAFGQSTFLARKGDRDGQPIDEEPRARKRDVVSGMVTGSLISGIGWVIGAPVTTE